MSTGRHYLHGDYLEAIDRGPDSVVYCGICDGNCLPSHLYDEHELEQNFARLKAARKMLERSRQLFVRPVDSPNYLDGTPDPCGAGR